MDAIKQAVGKLEKTLNGTNLFKNIKINLERLDTESGNLTITYIPKSTKRRDESDTILHINRVFYGIDKYLASENIGLERDEEDLEGNYKLTLRRKPVEGASPFRMISGLIDYIERYNSTRKLIS